MLAPVDNPVMADFVANLDYINGLAESAEGFVWRLKGDGNDATSNSFLSEMFSYFILEFRI